MEVANTFCMSLRSFKTLSPFYIENWQLLTLKISIYFPFTVLFPHLAAHCLIMRPELWLLLPASRAIYEFTSLSIFITMSAWSWFSEP